MPFARVDNSLRVLIFNPSYPPIRCGIGDFTRGLATALVNAGHEVGVVTATGTAPPTEGPPCVLPVLSDWDAWAFMRGRTRFRRPTPNVVVSNYPSVLTTRHARLLFYLPGLAKLTLGRPRTVLIVHEFTRTSGLDRSLLAIAMLAADTVVAVTEADRDAIVERYSKLARRTVVRAVPSSIPVATVDAIADTELRESLVSPGNPLIAYFGFISSPEKGFEDLLAALAHSNATLVVTGELDLTQPYHVEVAAEISRLGLGNRVRFLGFLPDIRVARLLRAADAVVLPFRDGARASNTSLVAALINGSAVITTRGPQTPEWLRDRETALLVDGHDAKALAQAIADLLTDDGLAGRLRSEASLLTFGWDEMVGSVVKDQRS